MRQPLAALAALAALATLAAAAPARADGVYGRFDGDLELRFGAGAAIAAGGPMLSVEAATRYLATAGIYTCYTDALGARAPVVARSIAAGVEIAPLFLARYATNLEGSVAHLDLLLDSLAIGFGAFWAAPNAPGAGSFDERPGLEIALGLAIPFLPRATGPFLRVRGAIRWRDADLAGAPGPGPADRGALLSITLGWHHVVRARIVDPGDAIAR